MIDLVVLVEPISTRQEVKKVVWKSEEIIQHDCRQDMEKEMQILSWVSALNISRMGYEFNTALIKSWTSFLLLLDGCKITLHSEKEEANMK